MAPSSTYYRRHTLWVAAAVLIVAAVNTIQHAQAQVPASSSTYLRIIVVGATGDLAAKYLWVACFRLALEAWLQQGQRVVFIAAARESQQDGERWKDLFFTSEWADRVCGGTNAQASGQRDVCRTFYTNEFVPMITYKTLDTAAHYEALARHVEHQDNQLREQGLTESGRLVYLAIPPKAFLQASTYLSKYLRPPQHDAFMRVIVEKPFGRDLASAEVLAEGLRLVLRDEEMLLMDHYAGKPGLRVIESFVRLNPKKLVGVWNGHFIGSIDIRMSETETCEHRLDYFDRNGIIRDVMANHLQLLLGVVVSPSLKHCKSRKSSNMSQDEFEELCPKEMTRFLRSLRPVGHVVVGQYEGYNQDPVQCDSRTANRSTTATAAYTQLHSLSEDWSGTRFSISAAKATSTRKAEVTVIFKLDPAISDDGNPCSIRFTIQSGLSSSGERIQVKCASLGALKVPAVWSLEPSGDYVLSSSPGDPSAWELGDSISAYDTLLRDAAQGRSDNFMKIDEVLASWRLWSPIVHLAERVPRESIVTYPVGATAWMQFGAIEEGPLAPQGFRVGDTCPITTPWESKSCRRRDAAGTDSAVRDT